MLSFVRVFHSSPSAFLWEDDEGTVHTIHQGDGGEQGDAMMPLLFCLGQHAALEATQRGLNPNEKLFASLDDLCLLSKLDRVGRCTIWHRGSCGPIVGSVSMAAKHMCGTGVVPSQRHVMFCREWLSQCIRKHACGADLMCRRKSKGSRCWEHQLVTMISCVVCWPRRRRSIEFHWTPSRLWQTCNQRGSCCSIVPLHERTTTRELSDLSWRPHLLRHTITDSGNVSATL